MSASNGHGGPHHARGDDDGHRHERSADRREDAGRGRRDGAREGAGRDGGPRGGAAGPRDRERSRSPHSRPSPRARDDRGSERDRNVRSRPDSPRRDRGRGGSPARRDARGRVDEDRGDRRGGGWRGDGRPDERVRNGKAADRNDRSGGPGFAAGEGRRWEGDRGGGRGDGERGRGRGRGRGDGPHGQRWGGEARGEREGAGGDGESKAPAPEPEPDFGLSGRLAAESRTVMGVTLKYSEPPEARNPSRRWRLYVFKGGEIMGDPIPIHRQSHYLFGRERIVAHIPTDHPSCSGQHAVLQYRLIEKEDPKTLAVTQRIAPYVIDLGSTNGTFINGERIEPERYYELLEKDTIKLGNSSREYVLLAEDTV